MIRAALLSVAVIGVGCANGMPSWLTPWVNENTCEFAVEMARANIKACQEKVEEDWREICQNGVNNALDSVKDLCEQIPSDLEAVMPADPEPIALM